MSADIGRERRATTPREVSGIWLLPARSWLLGRQVPTSCIPSGPFQVGDGESVSNDGCSHCCGACNAEGERRTQRPLEASMPPIRPAQQSLGPLPREPVTPAGYQILEDMRETAVGAQPQLVLGYRLLGSNNVRLREAPHATGHRWPDKTSA